MDIAKVANQDDARYHSGKRGYGGSLIKHQPPEITPNTTGGGTVNFGGHGMVVDAGQSGNDSAIAEGLASTYWRGAKHTLEFVFSLNTDTPLSSYKQIGYLQSGGTYNSVYLNLSSEEFIYARKNNGVRHIAAAHSLNAFDGAYLRIEWQGNTATIYLESPNDTSKATLDTASPLNAGTIVRALSGTGGEKITVSWFRHTIDFKQ